MMSINTKNPQNSNRAIRGISFRKISTRTKHISVHQKLIALCEITHIVHKISLCYWICLNKHNVSYAEKFSFSHPDFTVGSRLALDQPAHKLHMLGHGLAAEESITFFCWSPPVGNFTLPRRSY